jgi:hypothetical protein
MPLSKAAARRRFPRTFRGSVSEGFKPKQAVAIALKKAGRSRSLKRPKALSWGSQEPADHAARNHPHHHPGPSPTGRRAAVALQPIVGPWPSGAVGLLLVVLLLMLFLRA